MSHRLGLLLVLVSACDLACDGGAPPAGTPAIDTAAFAWRTDLDAALADAKRAHRPALVDFTADWCTPCKELELKTYPDARVMQAARRFVAVKVDATDMTPPMERLFARYGVMSLPTIVFLDSSGNLLSEPRVTRFLPPEAFVQALDGVK